MENVDITSHTPQPQIPIVKGNTKSKNYLKVLLVAGISLLVILLITIMTLNYLNIIPISKNIKLLSFLPKQNQILSPHASDFVVQVKSTSTPSSHKIADMPLDENLIPIFSPSKDNVIFEAPEGHGNYIIPNCKACADLSIILAGFSYTTDKLIYVGVSSENIYHIFTGDSKIQTLKNLGGIAISKNGLKIATWNRVGKNLVYYINGSEKAKYHDPTSSLSISSIAFSFDASKNGYVLNNKSNNIYKVFIEGKEQPYQGTDLSFGPQGDNFAYIGRISSTNHFLVFNGHRHKNYMNIGDELLDFDKAARYTWSPDGKRIAYVGYIFNNTPSPTDEGVIVVDGKELETNVDYVFGLKFSPNSSKIAYSFLKKNSYVEVKLNGQSLASDLGSIYSESELFFSPDSKRFLYTSNGFLNEKSESGTKIHNLTAGSISSLTFSPNSKRVAFLITRNSRQSYVSVDGVEYSGYSSVRVPIFSPDSTHVAFWQGEATYIPVDGYGYTHIVSNNSTVLVDYSKKKELVDAYGGYKEELLKASPSRISTYKYLQPDTFYYEILHSISFTEDSKFVKFNGIRGKEYWVIVIDATTGKEVIEPNLPIPTDLPTPTSITLPPIKSPVPTPTP